MSTKRLLSNTHSIPLPPLLKGSINWTRNTKTNFNPPFMPNEPSVLATSLIKSYFEKGLINEARTLFDEMPDRDVVMWTATISGYTSCREHQRAWNVFCDMFKNGVNPNAFTMSSVLKACKGMKNVSCGRLVHGFVVKRGMEGLIYVDNALVDMYATCSSSMEEACLVFDGIEEKNSVTWTTLISGYTHRGNGYKGLQIFKHMLLAEEESNPYSFSIAVRACASIGLQSFGKQMHAAVIKHGLEYSLPMMNSIVDMYCRCCCLSEANQYFHEMDEKDLITWNALIAGYEKSDSREALQIFSQMELEGFNPNSFTFTSVVAACANLAVLRCGQQVHGGIFRRGLDRNTELDNALIDMYAKCGNISDSHKIFCTMSFRNLVSWTSMMIGYGAHGYGKEAIELFDEMVAAGIKPDRIVFMAVLSACSHAGLIDQGLKYFNSMLHDYYVEPDHEIYGCVVDLLGRAGRIEEAYRLIQSMPFKPDESIWGALLGACRSYSIPKLGKLAARRVLKLKPNLVGPYIMLSNIFAAEGKWAEFARVRKLMKGMGSKKEAGRSWIEVQSRVYSFVVGDKVGSQVEWIYEVSKTLLKHTSEAGNTSDIDCLIHDMDDGT